MSQTFSLKKASTKQLERELANRKASRISVLKQEIANRENEIRSLESNANGIATESAAKGNAGIIRTKKSMAKTRVTNEKSLKDLLIDISQDGKTRTINDFLSAAQDRGWKSSSAKPYYVVAAAVATQEKAKVFNRVSKGSYELTIKKPDLV